MTTILLTGATSGIGRQTAFDLVQRGVQLIAHGRDSDKLANLARELAVVAPDAPAVLTVQADLTRLRDVAALGAHINATVNVLDVVLLNAGVYDTTRAVTPDGYERTFAVNHLASHLLTRALLPLLRQTASERGEARVVTVASIAHNSGRVRWSDLMLEAGWERPGQIRPGYTAYSQSKLCNVLFANHLATLEADTGVMSNSLHPGVIDTKLLRAGFDIEGAPLSEGSKMSVRLALDPALRGVTGQYFADMRLTTPAPQSRSAADAARLWAESDRLVDAALARSTG